MGPTTSSGDDAAALDIDELIAATYPELVRMARSMSWGAPTTLLGSKGVHAVVERILRVRQERLRAGERPKEFRSTEHFVGYSIVVLRHLWSNHRESKERRAAREEAWGAPVPLAGAGHARTAVEVLEVHRLLDRLLHDRRVPRRRQIADAVQLCHLAGFTLDEAARVLRVRSKDTVRQRLVEFRDWAEQALAPERAALRADLEALLRDGTMRERVRVYESVRRCVLDMESADEAAAALQVAADDVRGDLALFQAWQESRRRAPPARGGTT